MRNIVEKLKITLINILSIKEFFIEAFDYKIQSMIFKKNISIY